MASLTAESRLRQTPRCAWQVIDGSAFVVMPRDRMLHMLNEVGTHLWKRLEKERTLEDLVASVTEEFEVDADTAGKDVKEFLKEMMARGLVECV
jgi:hypothetical protein